MDSSLRAKQLRRNSTNAEILFWQKVRNRQVNGFKFKWQCPVDQYVVDFICPEAMLVVGIDGGEHNDNLRDKARDEYLAAKGIKTIRFWNNEVLGNIDGVLQKLGEELISLSSARLLPRGGRGQGVRGRSGTSGDGSCVTAPSSQPSPAVSAGEKEQGVSQC